MNVPMALVSLEVNECPTDFRHWVIVIVEDKAGYAGTSMCRCPDVGYMGWQCQSGTAQLDQLSGGSSSPIGAVPLKHNATGQSCLQPFAGVRVLYPGCARAKGDRRP